MHNIDTKWVEIKEIRNKTGLGLRESLGAWERWGSAKEALIHIEASAAGEASPARDAFESEYDRDRRQARLYRALQNSKHFIPAEDGVGWIRRAKGDSEATAEQLDHAAAKLPQD